MEIKDVARSSRGAPPGLGLATTKRCWKRRARGRAGHPGKEAVDELGERASSLRPTSPTKPR